MNEESPVRQAVASRKRTSERFSDAAVEDAIGATASAAGGDLERSTAASASAMLSEARRRERSGQADRGYQQESGGEHAQHGAEAVQEIERGDMVSRKSRLEPQHRRAHQRERGAEQDRLGSEEERRNRPLRRAERAFRVAHGGQHGRVSPLRRRDEDGVEAERDHADRGFHPRVDSQRIAHAARYAGAQPSPDGEPADEDDQHDALRIGRVPEEELQVVRPDGLVDQPGEARHEEEHQDQVGLLSHGAGLSIISRERSGATVMSSAFFRVDPGR